MSGRDPQCTDRFVFLSKTKSHKISVLRRDKIPYNSVGAMTVRPGCHGPTKRVNIGVLRMTDTRIACPPVGSLHKSDERYLTRNHRCRVPPR